MSSAFSEDNEVLKDLWKESNPEQQQYLEKQKVILWVRMALQRTNTLANFQESLTDLDGLIKQYLIEAHGVSQDGLQNIALSYGEGVDFLRWLTNENAEDKQNVIDQPPIEKEIDNQEQQHLEENNQNEQPIKMEETQNEKQPLQLQQKGHTQQPKNQVQPNTSKIHKKQVQQIHKQEVNFRLDMGLDKKTKTEGNYDDEQINDIGTSNPNEFNLEAISRKYKQYLKIIFEHYCKISYATGQDPTFEQILHKTTIMTINKFMIFCKDFEISKISPAFNRNYLIQMFKKNSQCYKEMSYEQFCDVIKKLAFVGFPDSKKNQQKQEKEKIETIIIEENMIKILQFCEISTAKKFRQKMKKLNIQYRVGPKTKAELKVAPEGYRFKYVANNGKSQQQVKQEIQERKQHRSERKFLLQQKVSNGQNEEGKIQRKRVMSKKIDNSYQKPLGAIRQISKNQTVNSTNLINKILTPPIPPPRKITNPPQLGQPPKSYQTPTNPNNGIMTSNSAANNIFKKQLGYADLHKLKGNEGYSKKRQGGSNSHSRQGKGNFKLNSIVEEARMQILDLPQREAYGDNLTESIATNSRQQTSRAKNYDLSKMNDKIQMINQRNRRDRQIQEQLNEILDMSNDQDQFLKEHLERQKKNEIIGKRLSQKITNLQKLK